MHQPGRSISGRSGQTRASRRMNRDPASIGARLGRAFEDRLTRWALVVAALAAAVLSFGLVYYWQHTTVLGESLSASYGRRRGRGADSVNGTAVLADMFELKGLKVRTVDRLSPKLRKEVDVIVWFPNDFEPPTKKQREFLEQWLAAGSQRTLIYVGRDYDASPHYWMTIQTGA